jgi:delta-aminolevulinic acid dehydratase/porphobilinogen synthase
MTGCFVAFRMAFTVCGAFQDDHQEPIVSLPGQFRWGIHKLVHGIEHLVKAGLKAVLLFGVVSVSSPLRFPLELRALAGGLG